MRSIVLANVVVLGLVASACSALGPKANVSLVNAEVKSTKAVDNIVIPNVTGIDNTGNTGKALLASALKAYGARSRPIAAANAVLSAAGAPDGLADVLTAPHQAEFIKLSTEYFDKGAKAAKPEAIKLPSAKLSFAVPAGMDGMKTVIEKIKGEVAVIGEVAGALKSGNSAGLSAALGKSQNLAALVTKLDEVLFDKLAVTYVLLTHVTGDEAAWNGGKRVQYSAALVNIKTGQMRYFATVEAKKGAVPTPYMAQLGMMSGNLFDAVNEKDPLPEKKGAEKTAFLHLNLSSY